MGSQFPVDWKGKYRIAKKIDVKGLQEKGGGFPWASPCPNIIYCASSQ